MRFRGSVRRRRRRRFSRREATRIAGDPRRSSRRPRPHPHRARGSSTPRGSSAIGVLLSLGGGALLPREHGGRRSRRARECCGPSRATAATRMRASLSQRIVLSCVVKSFLFDSGSWSFANDTLTDHAEGLAAAASQHLRQSAEDVSPATVTMRYPIRLARDPWSGDLQMILRLIPIRRWASSPLFPRLTADRAPAADPASSTGTGRWAGSPA